MLQHCANTIEAKKSRSEQSGKDEDRAEYYLGIEGFLLHFRNLLGFFINKRVADSDLTIDRPEQWAGELVSDSECREFTHRVEEINTAHGFKDGDCYRKISWFLQHCTTHRHQQTRSWDIAGMFADLEPVLRDFTKRFVPGATKIATSIVHGDGHSTATLTKFSVPTDTFRRDT